MFQDKQFCPLFNIELDTQILLDSNKRSIILQKNCTLISLINVALRLFFLGKYSRPYVDMKDPMFNYFIKSFKNWVKIEKTSLYSVTNIPGRLDQFSFRLLAYQVLIFFPDPSFICNPMFIREIRVIDFLEKARKQLISMSQSIWSTMYKKQQILKAASIKYTF